MIYLDQSNFEETIASGVTLVDFYADWCGPCKILGKLMPHLSKKYEGKATVAKVNTEIERQLASEYRITSLPSVILFVDGVGKEMKSGLLPPEAYSELIDKYLS